MNRKSFLMAATAFCLLPLLGYAEVPGIDKAALAGLDQQVGKVMEGYNANSWKGFYGSGWAEQTKAIQTEQTFNALYTNMYLKQYGTLKSRAVDEKRSTFSTMNGLIVYNAVFSKKKGSLSVNFFKEGGAWKIQQLQVGP